MKHFVKKIMAVALVMAMAFSTVTTSYAAEVSDDAVSTENVVLTEDTVSPQSTQATTVYKDVFMETYYGYTGNVRVKPPKGAKLMVYLSWHTGGTTWLQFKESTAASYRIVDTIGVNNGPNYTHNITLVANCDGETTYDIRFHASRESVISYLIEAQY